MAIEEQVIQSDSVNPAEQPVAETASQPKQPQGPNLDAIKAEYEAKLAAAQKKLLKHKKNLKASKVNLTMFISKERKSVPKN